ncbi:hypothetical protein L218DRAFT_943337 [Marasmius fiardii PR-910]|nr:hypothetical protein L218DRAFT_943337 [Marasmius fiardii PR-910]
MVCDGLVSANPGENATSPISPPIHIFHGIFQQFTRDANNYKAPLEPDFLRKVLKFMIDAAMIKTDHENFLNSHIRTLLSSILGHHSTSQTNPDSTCPDISTMLDVSNGSTIRSMGFIGEIERALGEGGNEVTIQATNSWRKMITQPGSDNIVVLCCYPAFLIAIAGPWLVVLGGVFTNQFIVQRLTHMLWIAPSTSHDDQRVRELGRVLRALKNGLDTLQTFYKNLVEAPPLFGPERPTLEIFLTPIPTSQATGGGSEPEFGDESGEKVVIKFVETYSEDVHKLLANRGHAPKLRYFGALPQNAVDAAATDSPLSSPYGAEGVITPAIQMQIVVMDYVEGCNLTDCMTPVKDCGQDKPFIDVLKGIVGELHKEYVLGNICPPNVVIDTQGEVKLLDFDWAGKDGEDIPGVGGLLPICKQHDKDMLELFLQPKF